MVPKSKLLKLSRTLHISQFEGDQYESGIGI